MVGREAVPGLPGVSSPPWKEHFCPGGLVAKGLTGGICGEPVVDRWQLKPHTSGLDSQHPPCGASHREEVSLVDPAPMPQACRVPWWVSPRAG